MELRPALVGICIGLVTVFVLRWLLVKPHGTKLSGRALPGPKGLPFLGNVHELPPYHSWLKFTSWAKKHGSLYRINLFGANHVIVTSGKVANDLLVERGAHYSSREQLPFAVKLVTDLRIAFLPYNDLWRRERKIMATLMKNPGDFAQVQLLESAKLICSLMKPNANREQLLNVYSASIIMRLTYGRSVDTGNEDYFKKIVHNAHEFERYATPGAYLVDALPILLWLPRWLAPFKREADRLGEFVTDTFRSMLSDAVQDAETSKSAQPTFVQQWLATKDQYNFTFDQTAFVMGQLFEAGAVTTAAAMHSYLLVLVAHPEWHAKIQAEVDSVIPETRVPNMADIERLPTVRAVIKEALRWRPVTPGNLPHKLTKDDVYDGYFMPKGTNVHAIQWAIHRDPEVYPGGDECKPERWLDPSYPTYREPLSLYPNIAGFSAFGFGRRICPGANLAERSLYIFAARLAWACDVRKQVRADGSEINIPDYDYTHGFSCQPNPFPFVLEARNENRTKLMAEEWRLQRLTSENGQYQAANSIEKPI